MDKYIRIYINIYSDGSPEHQALEASHYSEFIKEIPSNLYNCILKFSAAMNGLFTFNLILCQKRISTRIQMGKKGTLDCTKNE